MSEHHLGEDLLAIAAGSPTLTTQHQAELEAHLSACTECKAAVAEARRVLELVDTLPVPAPGPAFARSLAAKLDAIDAERSLWQRMQAALTLPRFAGLAVAMAGIVLAVLVLRPGVEPESLELAEPLEVADRLELYEDLDVVENLDVLDDLDAIETLEAEPG